MSFIGLAPFLSPDQMQLLNSPNWRLVTVLFSTMTWGDKYLYELFWPNSSSVKVLFSKLSVWVLFWDQKNSPIFLLPCCSPENDLSCNLTCIFNLRVAFCTTYSSNFQVLFSLSFILSCKWNQFSFGNRLETNLWLILSKAKSLSQGPRSWDSHKLLFEWPPCHCCWDHSLNGGNNQKTRYFNLPFL